MIDYSIKSKSYYNDIKIIFNKEYNMIYKVHYSPKTSIGDCSFLYRKYKPSSYEDFFNKYIKDYTDDFSFENHKGNIYCGRSLQQLIFLSERYFNDIQDYNKKMKKKNDVTQQMCFDDLINHIIIETFDGKIVERFLSKMISESSSDFVVEECNGDKDSEYGADIIVKKKSDRNYIRYLQIKPHTFFLGTKNKSLISDRKRAIMKEYKLRKSLDNQGYIEYIIYNKEALLLRNEILIAKRGKKTKFKITDLIFDNGNPKLDIINDFVYEIPGKQKENVQCNQ